MMPKPESVKLLAELYRLKRKGIEMMKSSEIISFFHQENVAGYEKIPSDNSNAYIAAQMKRALLNRTNRGYLSELEQLYYIKRIWKGREFFIELTSGGEHIACVSGLLGNDGL
jgi:hypothetical protein